MMRLDNKGIKMKDWKTSTCGACIFAVDPPGPPNPDLSAPKLKFCRQGPPNIIVAMAPPRVQGKPPIPVPLGSMYPLLDMDFTACSKFETEELPTFKPFQFKAPSEGD